MGNLFNKVKPYLGLIVTIFCTLAIVSFIYVQFDIAIKLDAGYIIRVVLSLALQILLICIWIPEGKKNGEKTESYKANKEYINSEIGLISSKRLYKPLDDFCEWATQQNILAYIIDKCNKIHINYNRYKSDTEYANGLTDKEREKVAKYEKKALTVVKPINANEITACSHLSARKFDTTNHEKTTETIGIVVKIIVSAVMVICTVSFNVSQSKSFAEGFAELVFWLTVIAGTIYFSLSSGYNLTAVTRNDYFKRLADFFQRFHAWQDGKIGTDLQ